jgi:hypothetical protein
VIEPGQRTGLAREAFGEAGAGADLWRKDFHSDDTVEGSLPRPLLCHASHCSIICTYKCS